MKLLYFTFALCLLTYCNAYQWNDCASPLMKAIYYESVTVFPSEVTVGKRLSINVRANTVEYIQNAGTHVEVLHGDSERVYYNTTTRDLCTLLDYNDQKCPITPGTHSYSYIFESVPQLPAGKYQIKIINFVGRRVLGCVRVSVDVKDVQQESCKYTSTLDATIIGEIQRQSNTPASNGTKQWIQVGPIGIGGNLTWGTFERLTASKDLLANATYANDELRSFVWGINGTLNNTIGTESTYRGDLFIGYKSMVNNTERVEQFLRGKFELIYTGTVLSGTFEIIPRWNHIKKYDYPVIFGNLGKFRLTVNQEGDKILTGKTTYCTCGTDACGICGGDGSTCAGVGAQQEKTYWTTGAIVVGVVGGLIGISAIAFFAYQLMKMRRVPVIDDMDLTDPQKPDYGTMAINEIIQEGDNVA